MEIDGYCGTNQHWLGNEWYGSEQERAVLLICTFFYTQFGVHRFAVGYLRYVNVVLVGSQGQYS